MDPIIVYIIASILAVGAIVSFTRGKRSKVLAMPKNVTGVLFLIGALFLFALQMGYLAQFNPALTPLTVSGGSDTSDGGSNVNADIIGCSTTDSQTITLSAVNKYTEAATGGTHRYRLNGAPALTVSDAGTLTAYVGNKISVLWMNGTLTGYFSKPETYSVECNGPRTFYAKLTQNGSISASLKDNLGNTVNGGTNNMSLAAGDVKDAEVTLSGQYQREFPYGFVGVVDYNKTTMDDVILNKDGVNFASSTVPQTDTPTYGVDDVRKAYEVPAVVSNADLVFKATLDADDSNEPLSESSDVILRLYGKNYFINEKNGGAFEGPSVDDENGALTRTGYVTVTIDID